ncbi:hypothetical protein ACFX15_039320 [Malus domestica]
MSCDTNGGDAFCGLVEMGEKSLLEVRKVYLMRCYATSAGSSSFNEESDSDELDNNEAKVRLRNVAWAITSLALKRAQAADANKKLDSEVAAIIIDPS